MYAPRTGILCPWTRSTTLAVAAVLGGCVVTADLVWNFADGVMGLMALPNLIAIALLSGLAFHYSRTTPGNAGRVEIPSSRAR